MSNFENEELTKHVGAEIVNMMQCATIAIRDPNFSQEQKMAAWAIKALVMEGIGVNPDFPDHIYFTRSIWDQIKVHGLVLFS